ncbi:Anthocyanidin reductase [Carex littledalei]|uniref:Anthocyanidin reductase n=1 Tax=Carex littledalei TaxID=544730 RepID=A0A833RME5_9POAL|nr:Anthocyanidin reductase [Carex littledalei]
MQYSISCDFWNNLLVKPAVEGTLNVLRAAKDCGVKRVVLTSSSSAIAPNPHWPVDAVLTEESWADADTFKKHDVCHYY